MVGRGFPGTSVRSLPFGSCVLCGASCATREDAKNNRTTKRKWGKWRELLYMGESIWLFGDRTVNEGLVSSIRNESGLSCCRQTKHTAILRHQRCQFLRPTRSGHHVVTCGHCRLGDVSSQSVPTSRNQPDLRHCNILHSPSWMDLDPAGLPGECQCDYSLIYTMHGTHHLVMPACSCASTLRCLGFAMPQFT